MKPYLKFDTPTEWRKFIGPIMNFFLLTHVALSIIAYFIGKGFGQ